MKAAAAWGTLTHSSCGVVQWTQLGLCELPVTVEPEVICNRLWQATSVGSPSHCLQRQELASESSGSPAHRAPLNNDASLSRLPLVAFPAIHPLTRIPSDVSGQPTALLSLDPFSQPHAFALSPHKHWQALVPGRDSHGSFPRRLWDGQHSGAWTPQAEETPAGGVDMPTQMGAPPSAHRGQRSHGWGKGL